MKQLSIYRALVLTTNRSRDVFVIDRPVTSFTDVGKDYRNCEDGYVYVLAESMDEAARQVPHALKIERVGVVLAVASA